MAFTQFSKLAWVNHALSLSAYSPANTSVWSALFTSDSGLPTGSLSDEATDAGRVAMPFEAASSTADRAVLNSTSLSLSPTVGGDVVTHFGILDAATSGNLLCFGALDHPFTTSSVASCTIAAKSVGIQVDAGGLVGLSAYFIDAMLDFMFAAPNVTFSLPTASYLSLHSSVSSSGSGEFSSSGYTRASVSWGTASIISGDAKSVTSSAVTITGVTDTPAAQFSIWDASTGGNLIGFCDSSDVAVPSGGSVTLSAGASLAV